MPHHAKLQAKLDALQISLDGGFPTYAEEAKAAFLRAARGAFLELAAVVGEEGGVTADIAKSCVSVNPAGIACAGDVLLHTETFYLQIGDSYWSGLGALLRTVRSANDFGGHGANQWIGRRALLSAETLVAEVLRVSREARAQRNPVAPAA